MQQDLYDAFLKKQLCSCGHLMYAHNSFGLDFCEEVVFHREIVGNKEYICQCSYFRPMNNLEYVAWLKRETR